MSNKKTAVQWLQDKLFELEIKIDPSIAEETFFLFAQAKAMEKEQIKDAYLEGESNDGKGSWNDLCDLANKNYLKFK